MVAGREDLTPVAVCVPAHGNPTSLATTLASIDRAEARADATVIVAIDGPDRELEKVARANADVVVVLRENRGSYAARNAAITALPAEAGAVLFTDSDTVVDPTWITGHLRALATAPRSGGPVRFELSDAPSPAEVVDAMRHLDQRFYVDALGYAATANLAVRREVLDELRFDEALRSAGDFEFGQRCAARGYPIVFTEDAAVAHRARTSSKALLSKMTRVAKGATKLAAAGHPATDRRRARPTVRAAAAAAGLRPSPLWLARAFALDTTCSLTFARHNPSVIRPAIRRRLGAGR